MPEPALAIAVVPFGWESAGAAPFDVAEVVAADLLRSGGLKIADIAERVGYGSDAAFSRAFHRQVGVWPADFR